MSPPTARQATTTFMGQNTEFTVHGEATYGKIERRKELALMCLMHPNTCA